MSLPLKFPVDEREVALSAIRAQGAGGQNVNKVSSAVHLRFDIVASSLPEDITNLFIRKVIMTHTGTRVAKRKTSPVLVISECGAMHRVPAASFRPLIAPVAWPLAA